jgi:sec-independent protein translocase protein TatB|tara:strand:+ start:1083 stop:1502 length:420 start_codon:yes stop_codon:yes gene_type:complete
VLDIGFFELGIIGLACLLVVGPKRLPVLFKTFGVLLSKGQSYVSQVKSDVEKEINLSEFKDAENEINNIKENCNEEFISLNKELQDLSASVNNTEDSISQEKNIKFFINSPKLSWKEENFQLKLREKVKLRSKAQRRKR